MGTELTKVTFPDTNYIDLDSRVSNVAWDSTNKKLTQTFGETTTDIVTGETILDPLIPVKTASGSLVSFDDGADLPMPLFVCNIDAVQDLHGQDAPWVGGAGKNKLPLVLADIKADNTEGTWNGNTYIYNGVTIEVLQDINGNVNGFKFNGTASNNIRFSITRRNIENFPTGDYIYNIQNTIDIANLWVSIYQPQSNVIYVKDSTNVNVSITSGQAFGGGYIYSNAGNIFNNVLIQPMLRLATETDPTFAPYENICPISGHTGLDAWVRGKNLLDVTTITIDGFTFIEDIDGYVSESPNNSDNRTWGYDKSQYKLIIPAGDWKLVIETKTPTSNKARGIIIRDSANNTIRELWADSYNSVGIKTINFTLTEKTNIGIMTKMYDAVARFMIVPQSASNDFEFYNFDSQTIQVSWQTEAGEVFGGYVDLVSGKMVVDRGGVIYDGSESWVYENASAGGNFYYRENRFLSGVCGDNILCNIAKGSTYVRSEKDRVFVSYANNVNITIGDTLGIDNAADFKTWLSTHNMQVVAPLATPITYQLTPTQIKSLLGNNNAWCSTGDVNVKYTTQPYDGISAKYSEYAYNALNTVPVQNNAGYHNSIYRGKSLGTSITAEQWAAIRAGTFEDMYIGDYWTLSTTIGGTTSNVKYVIAGFDYWWNCGDSYPQSSNKHHVVLVPASNLYSAKMNDSNITTGGYIGSKMYIDYLANARTGISTLFGDHLYSVRRLFVNAVNAAGQGTAWGWYTSSVDLMNETMVYGHPVWTTSGFEVGVDRTILPLFALNPASASIRSYWWLRCAATSANFAYVNYYGYAHSNNASYSYGVRPAFAIY